MDRALTIDWNGKIATFCRKKKKGLNALCQVTVLSCNERCE